MIDCQFHKQLAGVDGPMNLELDFQIREGEFVAIYGRSGSGKSTILRIVAGLEKEAKGKITAGDQTWLDSKSRIFVPPQGRSVGMVFQNYALFPNMTVRQNLEFAQVNGQKEPERIAELLESTGLSKLADRYPPQLSGGQQQRVALARAIARKPRLLLLDEPLSALDWEMRQHLQQELQDLHARYGLTALLVSHDVPEIKKLASRVLVLDDGKIVKEGSPEEVLPNVLG